MCAPAHAPIVFKLGNSTFDLLLGKKLFYALFTEITARTAIPHDWVQTISDQISHIQNLSP